MRNIDDFKLNKFLDEGEKFDISNMSFEDISLKMLVVNETNFVDQLEKHAAGIAYFGALAKGASRDLHEAEKAYKNRYNEMFSECSTQLKKSSDNKPLTREIEAFVQSKYETELTNLDSKLNILQEFKDNTEVYYESWKQKSYMLNNMTSLTVSNFYNSEAKTVSTNTADKLRGLAMKTKGGFSN